MNSSWTFLRAGVYLCVVFGTICPKSYAVEPHVTAAELGAVIGYPPQRLSVEDATESRNQTALRKKRNLAISSHLYSTDDNTFAPLSITIGEEATLLTQEMRDYAEKALITPGSGISRISLPDLGEGYSGLGMFGPGASMKQIIVTLPKSKRDVQITITIPGETVLEVVPGFEGYYSAINDPAGIAATLLKCVNIVASRVAQTGALPNSPSPTPPIEKPQTVPSERVVPVAPRSDQTPVADDSTLPPKPVPPPRAVGVDSPSIWPWVVGIFALILIAWLFWKLRSKK